MTKHFPLTLVVLAWACRTEAAPLPGWSTNLEAATHLALTNQRPLLVYFTASWCGPCRRMADTTFHDSNVIRQLQGLAPVVLDVDQHQERARLHNVTGIPAFLLITPDGTEFSRTTGYMSADDFIRWLMKGAATLQSTQQAELELAQQQRSIISSFQSQEPAVRAKGCEALFDLCSRREPAAHKFATIQLKELARREPSILLEGLNHPALATRLQVANVLREKIGAEFDFDPWDSAPARTNRIALWRSRLAKFKDP